VFDTVNMDRGGQVFDMKGPSVWHGRAKCLTRKGQVFDMIDTPGGPVVKLQNGCSIVYRI
jgi:hypothetical protein